jgi:hypothetical protein
LVPDSFRKLELYKFFSEDLYDLKYLPKKIYKKNTKPEKDYLKIFKNHDF